MGFLVILIPVACCLAVPAILAVAAFARSRNPNKIQDNPKLQEGARSSLLENRNRK